MQYGSKTGGKTGGLFLEQVDIFLRFYHAKSGVFKIEEFGNAPKIKPLGFVEV